MKLLIRKNEKDLKEASFKFNSQQRHSSQETRGSFLLSPHYFDLWKDTLNETCSNDLIRLTFIINMDDAQMVNSSQRAATPVSAAIAELNPNVRYKRDNILLLAFYWGLKKISYQQLSKKVLLEAFQRHEFHKRCIEIELTCDKKVLIMIRIGAVVLDSPARSSFLDIMQWPNIYGCTRCTWKAKSVDYFDSKRQPKRKTCFTYEDDLVNNISAYHRTDEIYPQADAAWKQYLTDHSEPTGLQIVMRNSEAEFVHFKGIKSTPVMSNIIKNISATCIIDPMHCIDERITKELLDKLNLTRGQEVSKRVAKYLSQLRFPHDLERNNRYLSDVGKWTASQFWTFQYYILPALRPIFSKHHPVLIDIFILACMITFMVRSLDQVNLTVSDVVRSKKMVNGFLLCYQEVYGKESMKPNFHALLHIPAQAECFGPLSELSTYSFESLIGYLKSMKYGTHGYDEQMVKYFLQHITYQAIFSPNEDTDGHNGFIHGEMLRSSIEMKKIPIQKRFLINIHLVKKFPLLEHYSSDIILSKIKTFGTARIKQHEVHSELSRGKNSSASQFIHYMPNELPTNASHSNLDETNLRAFYGRVVCFHSAE